MASTPATNDRSSTRRHRRPGLSPSRAQDFMRCPLLYRFRVVDRLPEPPSPAALRGTLVHSVLEHLYDLPPTARTKETAQADVDPRWEELLAERPEAAGLFDSETELTAWLEQARELVAGYFDLEDPSRLEPAEREYYVELELPDGPLLRGYVDRLDVAPNGAIRIVDYKTGRSPSPRFEQSALFQMRFYALLVWRLRGVLPKMLQLVYLGNRELMRYEPTVADLEATERKVRSLWTAIQSVAESGSWTAQPNPLCAWCSFQAHCPQYGGTPPEIPADGLQRVLDRKP